MRSWLLTGFFGAFDSNAPEKNTRNGVRVFLRNNQYMVLQVLSAETGVTRL